MGNIPHEAIMFGTLLESTRSREPKAAFTVMSVVAHVALVAGAAAATVSVSDVSASPRPPEVVDVVYTVIDRVDDDPLPIPRQAAERGGATPRTSTLATIEIPKTTIIPVGIPTQLPPIGEALGAVHAGQVATMAGNAIDGPITGSYLGSSGAAGGVLTPDAVERVVSLRVPAEPAYPPALRNSGVEGVVRVRFVVDAAGRVEMSSVDIRDSAHDAFSAAVRAALPRLRFAPAQVAGRPVRQLVEMPFVFSLTW